MQCLSDEDDGSDDCDGDDDYSGHDDDGDGNDDESFRLSKLFGALKVHILLSCQSLPSLCILGALNRDSAWVLGHICAGKVRAQAKVISAKYQVGAGKVWPSIR